MKRCVKCKKEMSSALIVCPECVKPKKVITDKIRMFNTLAYRCPHCQEIVVYPHKDKKIFNPKACVVCGGLLEFERKEE